MKFISMVSKVFGLKQKSEEMSEEVETMREANEALINTRKELKALYEQTTFEIKMSKGILDDARKNIEEIRKLQG